MTAKWSLLEKETGLCSYGGVPRLQGARKWILLVRLLLSKK
jgi:hypothetical protein